jgi:hypothetical protein
VIGRFCLSSPSPATGCFICIAASAPPCRRWWYGTATHPGCCSTPAPRRVRSAASSTGMCPHPMGGTSLAPSRRGVRQTPRCAWSTSTGRHCWATRSRWVTASSAGCRTAGLSHTTGTGRRPRMCRSTGSATTAVPACIDSATTSNGTSRSLVAGSTRWSRSRRGTGRTWLSRRATTG